LAEDCQNNVHHDHSKYRSKLQGYVVTKVEVAAKITKN